jgi:hypothetical protein
MSGVEILLLCAVVFLLGFGLGQVKAARDWNKVIDVYKEIIEEYRKALVGSK